MFTNLFSNISQHKAIYMMWAGVLGFFANIKLALFGLFILVLIDTATGILAAPAKERESKKLKAIVQKLITYMTIPILAHLMETTIFPTYGIALNLQLAKLMATVIAGVEIYSILENMYKLTGLRVFQILTKLTTKKIEDITGENITPEANITQEVNK